MSWDTPIGTVWPALVAFAFLVLSVRSVWREIRLPRGWYWVAGLALVVRLVWVPALEMHQFDGHEAEYWDLFRGFREPSRGGTVMVPAMQWFWWLAGHVLPESHSLVLVITAVMGVVALGLFSGAVGLLVGQHAGWLTAVLLALHPTHSAWSSSAYNVMLPHLFGCLAVYAAAVVVRRASPPGAWSWVAAFALSLSVAFRLDSGSMAWLVIGIVVLFRPNGVTVLERIRQWLPAAMGCLFAAALCAWPLIWPGELPGSGERSLSFGLNIMFLDVYHPYDSLVGILLLATSAVLAWRMHWRLVLPLVTLVVLHHLMMATFDDFGERHALVVVPAITGLVATAGVSVGALGSLLGFAALGLQVVDLQDLRERFYGAEVDFVAVLDEEPWNDLRRVEWTSAVPGACGWVAEDARVASKPALSHFNVLHPDEEREHRSEDGCLLWCVDVQDWRWSSRGVRDRALRLAHLFELTPGFVVTDPSTGYGCVVMEVGERLHSQVETPDGNHKAASRGNPPIP